MGDLRPWSPEPNVDAVSEERPSSSSSSSSSSLSNLTAISDEYWQRAEAFAQRIIGQVQPTVVSLERRKAVIDYVQRLIKNSLGCEVFPFGSVPLKTYLPDGDIDLTAFGGVNVEEALANDVCSVLEREDQNYDSDFVVKDVQLIRAEVKLVKCLVQNIVVDISFNQLGGLCTLCFLEQVDHLIGKDHLFKRSIILIKAWCYYESRILGAHHGLISTYALETLVLYVFHVFHSSLNGPLAVLYKFLDYFSKFDWDNYCISLNGPVRISSLPEVVVEAPENGGCNLLLTSDFLKDCTEMFSVPARVFEANSRTFPPKHLNIFDPLKATNNLGRSVSKGNFYRIRSAFTYGARKLGRILTMPEETVTGELSKFFSNTLDRHGSGKRPDVQDHATADEHLEFGTRFPFYGAESPQKDPKILEPDYQETIVNYNRAIDELPSFANRPAVSEYAEDLATCEMQGLSISGNALKSSSPGVEECLESCLDDDREWNPMPLSSETSNTFADLSGDYENHLNNLHHGRWWYEHAFSAMSPQMLPQFQGKNSWDLIRRSVHFRLNGTSHMNINGAVARPFFYPITVPVITKPAFAIEEMQKPRGTGTYFPNTNLYRDKTFAGRGRNQAGPRSPRPNGRIIPSQETNFYRDEHPHAQFPPHHGTGKFPSSDFRQNGSLEGRHSPKVNGFMHLQDRVVEYGSGGWHADPGSSTSQPVPGTQGPKPLMSTDQNRNSKKSYQLIDEDDFPPLSDTGGKGSFVSVAKKHEKSEQ